MRTRYTRHEIRLLRELDLQIVTSRVRTVYMLSMPNVNANILRWARETAGFTLEEAVKKLDIKSAHGVDAVDRLVNLEAGETSPKRSMLAKMAKCYRRSLLVFYMQDIPRKEDWGEDFRTLPMQVESREAGLVNAFVRDIRTRQSLVRASLEAAGESRSLPFIGSLRPKVGKRAVASSIEQTLGFERSEFRDKSKPQDSLAYLRECAEAAGIFVILIDHLGSWHSTINVEVFRGFALADDVAPFVAINANDSSSACCFTLVHELAHLWIGATGVSGRIAEQAVEKFCNDVASDVLLPSAEMANLNISEATPFAEAKALITEFANARKVSSTMVAYKLHTEGVFNLGRYQQLEAYYRQAYLDRKAAETERNAGKGGGPNYYIVRKHRVGPTLINLVERMLHEGYLSTTKAGKVLGVGAHNVHALFEKGRLDHAV